MPRLSLRYSSGTTTSTSNSTTSTSCSSSSTTTTTAAAAAQPQRLRLLPLPPFDGGAFDAGYNSRRLPFNFTTPPGLRRALIVSFITGHGSDENGCAEFCPTSHEFAVNGRPHSVVFWEAGSLWGCADKVRGPAGPVLPDMARAHAVGQGCGAVGDRSGMHWCCKR